MADDDIRPDDLPDDGSEPPEIPAAVDPNAQRRVRRTQKREQAESDDFWRHVLATPTGRREVWRMLAEAGTFAERFACGPNGFPQVESTWFMAGEQKFGLRWYLNLLALDPIGVRQMHIECDTRFARFVEKDGH